MVSGAVGAATEVKEKIKRIASHKLEVSGDDLEFRDGGVSVIGSPERKLSLAEIALAAYMFRLDLPANVDSGLAAQSTYNHPLTTVPSASNRDRSEVDKSGPTGGNDGLEAGMDAEGGDQVSEEALTETSTEWAPWHVVPADRNWVKAAAVAELLVDALEQLDPQLPPTEPGIEKLVIV